MIVVDSLNKTYREGEVTRSVLCDLSLRVEEAEFVAVRGASGSGKSTLLNLIAGLDLPDSGRIEIDGTRIERMSEHRRTLFRRRHIGFVFQFFSLIPTLTVSENIGFSLELNGLARSLPNRVGELLERVGLADRHDSYPDVLSGGEQQRVAIARAIAHRPRLVLADEPSGNLDAHTEADVMDLMEELHRQHHTTLVVATHSDSVAARAARTLHIDGLGDPR